MRRNGRRNRRTPFTACRGRMCGSMSGRDASWNARASAAARSEEARAEAVSLQHELAALVSRTPDAPLPLPADLPHVGPYLTHFHRLLAEGKAPASARVVDRRLPILWQAIEARRAV